MKMNPTVIAISAFGLLALALSEAATGTNYCKLTCRKASGYTKPGRHLLCKSFEHDETCPTKIVTSLSVQEKLQLVIEHNDLRNNVALGLQAHGGHAFHPQASNMMTLRWDEELEDVAKQLIVECTFYQTTWCMDLPRFELGMNWYDNEVSLTVDNDVLASGFDAWINEVDVLHKQEASGLGEINARRTPHYAQVVAGLTETMGCAKAISTEAVTMEESESVGYLACVYGPKMNKKGDNLYTKGTPCSACPRGGRCGKKWPGLCDYVTGGRSGRVQRSGDLPRNAQDAIYIPPDLSKSEAVGVSIKTLFAGIILTLLTLSRM